MLIHNGVRLDVDSYGQSDCCKAHRKAFSTCDTCEYGEWEEKDEDVTVDFYTGTAGREWYDIFDSTWKKSPSIKKIVVCAENKEIAKEKLMLSINSLNEDIKYADERYVLDENSIKRAYGFISVGDTILE